MTHAEVTLETGCPYCRAIATVHHGLSYYGPGGHLHYSETLVCTSCDASYVADGGDVPDHVRQAFLEDYGQWRVDLVAAGERRLDLARWLHEARGMPRADLVRFLDAVPTVLLRATRPEVEKVADDVRRLGGLAEVVLERPGTKRE
jgi:hypothetical protein